MLPSFARFRASLASLPRPRLAGIARNPTRLSNGLGQRFFSSKLPSKPGDFTEDPDAVKLQRSPMRQDPDDFSDGEQLIDDSFIIEPQHHKATLIWLHGIRDGQQATKPLFEATKQAGIRYVLPRAPKIPITALDNEPRRSWFDIVDQEICDEDDDEDDEGIAEANRRLQTLIDLELELLPDSRRLFIGGFAVGGAMAVHAGLACPKPLGGIISYAGYAALPDLYPEHIHEANLKTPVLAVHGGQDRAVHIEFARARYEVLRECGIDVIMRERWQEGHVMSPEQMLQFQMWMLDRASQV